MSEPIAPGGHFSPTEATAGALGARAALQLARSGGRWRGDLVLAGFPIQDLASALTSLPLSEWSPDRRVIAVDPAPAALDSLPRRTGLSARQGDVNALPVGDRSAATVALALDTSNGSWKGALLEGVRALVADGLLVVCHGRAEGDAIEHAVAEHLPVVARLAVRDTTAVVVGDGDVVVAPARAAPLGGVLVASAGREPVEPVALVADGLLEHWLARERTLLDDFGSCQAELSQLRQRLDRVDDLERRLVDAEQAAGTAREVLAERDHLASEVIRLSAHIAALEATISWKVTTPLRRVNTYARGMATETVRRIRG